MPKGENLPFLVLIFLSKLLTFYLHIYSVKFSKMYFNANYTDIQASFQAKHST